MPVKRDQYGLTVKQAQFVSEYVKDWNATQACIRMGVNPKSAGTSGIRYLKLRQVQERIRMIQEEINRESVATAEEVAEYLTRVMRGVETESVLRAAGRGVQTEIQQRVKAKDRLKAAELLGKHYSMFTEKVEHSGNVPVVIVDDLKD